MLENIKKTNNLRKASITILITNNVIVINVN